MIAKWIIIAWLSLGSIAVVAAIGRPSQPLTPGSAVVVCIFNIAIIVSMIVWWR